MLARTGWGSRAVAIVGEMTGEAVEPHLVAGRSIYGRDAAGYDSGRPSYPENVFENLTSRCGLQQGVRAVEVGPGTGQVTRQLIREGAHIVAVEPDPAMASYLQNVVPAQQLDVINTTFEESVLPDDDFDLAVAATSFHWVNQEIGIPKLKRVIRVGGWIALWWTIFGDPERDDPFEAAVSKLLGVKPQERAQEFRGQLDTALSRAEMFVREGFADFRCEVFHSTEHMDPSKARAFYGSLFRFLSLDEVNRQRMLTSVEGMVRTDFGGVIERPFVTVMYTGRKP